MRSAAERLLLVTEDAKIAITPGAKHAGNYKKSYHRYDAYSQATLLKQALDLGAWPNDLFFDFEQFRGVVRLRWQGPEFLVSTVCDLFQLLQECLGFAGHRFLIVNLDNASSLIGANGNRQLS